MYMDRNRIRSEHVFSTAQPVSDLSRYNVSALMEDTDQQLWVGTENDGSYVFNWEKQSLTHFNYRLMSKEIDYLTSSARRKYFANISDMKLSTMISIPYLKT